MTAGLGQGDGFDHGFGLVDRFHEFILWNRITDPSAAGLDMGHAILDQGCANGNATNPDYH